PLRGGILPPEGRGGLLGGREDGLSADRSPREEPWDMIGAMPSTISDAVAFPALFKKAAGLAGRVTPRVAGLGACLLGFVAFAISALFTVPILGLSDNHDFWRVMRPAGIQRLANRKSTRLNSSH